MGRRPCGLCMRRTPSPARHIRRPITGLAVCKQGMVKSAHVGVRPDGEVMYRFLREDQPSTLPKGAAKYVLLERIGSYEVISRVVRAIRTGRSVQGHAWAQSALGLHEHYCLSIDRKNSGERERTMSK